MAFKFSGWRRSGLINTICMFLLTGVMVGILAGSNTFSTHDVWDILGDQTGRVVYTGTCNRTRALNIGLHLLINIVSTLVLASSNFFMQVLCAPTRSELDEAHVKRKFLEIGVQSPRNLLRIPFPRSIGWLLLALTSVPLHVVFNSVVAETKESTDLQLVIASESFIKGGDYIRLGKIPFMCWLPGHDHIDWGRDEAIETMIGIAANASSWDNLRKIR